MSTVAQLWIHPVKSMLGTRPEALTLVPGGVHGDRGYAFFEVSTGQRISAKRYGALLGCRARLVEQPAPDGPVPPIEVTFPDGAVVTDHADITMRVSELLGFEVTLTAGDPGTLVDLAPVHILAASTLRLLAGQYPDGDWDPRRFRPNIFVDDDSAGDGDDNWLGCDIHIGAEAVLHTVIPTPRCVVTTRAQDGLARDQKILRTMTKVRRRDVTVLGDLPCAGSYADVVVPGVVRVGDAVRVERVSPRNGPLAQLLAYAAQAASQ